MQLTFLMQIYYSFEKNIVLNKKRKSQKVLEKSIPTIPMLILKILVRRFVTQ